MPLASDADVSARPDSSRRRLLLGGASLLALGLVVNVDRLWPAAGSPEDGETLGAESHVSSQFGYGEAKSDSRHAGEEGRMGRPSSRSKSGLYAMKGSRETKADSKEDVWGGPTGTEAGEVYGVSGLGLVGTGRGGGSGGGYGRGSGARRGHDFPELGEAFVMPRAEPTGGTHALPPGPVRETGFTAVADDPLSTFSIDVDTASYSAMRRELQWDRLPEPESVRIEEFVNYFDYDYAPPSGDVPFSVTAEVGECPWNPEHELVHVGLQGKAIAPEDLPPRNLVFLVDVSGSMDALDKLPLVKQSLAQLVETLRAEDKISLVVYAGAAGVVLPPTSGADKDAIYLALGRLKAGGSTNGGEGLAQAYAQARSVLMKDGVNRVILASDGDFNVGVSSHAALVKMIERERKSGVELSVLGYGMGHRDHTMEQLADEGNGNYAYIDGPEEAHKVLVEQAGGTLVTIAKDVKIQVELDPARVQSYRLVGYENRRLAHRGFADDRKDAGEIGAGHSVTALYEVVPRQDAKGEGQWMTLSLRYKHPKGDESSLVKLPVVAEARALDDTSDDFRFAAAVASFGMLLRGSEHEGEATYASAQQLALGAVGEDRSCRRHQLVSLVGRAARAAGASAATVLDVPRCEPGKGRVVQGPKVEPPGGGPVHHHVDPSGPSMEPEPVPRTVGEWVLEVLRLLPPLLALPLFVMALRRPRRRRE